MPEILQLEADHGPNAFLHAAMRAGFSGERIVMVAFGNQGGGALDDIDCVVDTIKHCLETQRRCSDLAPLEVKEAKMLAASRQDRRQDGDQMVDWMSRVKAWAGEAQ